MIARDIDSNERFWEIAVSQWLRGDKAPLSDALLDKSRAIEGDEIREFLSYLVATGKIPGGAGGRPDERHASVERAHVAAVFAQWEALGTKEAAIHDVAAARGIREGQLSGLVDKLRKLGFTFENWKKWGRPDFKDR